jgi:hypothetical protein
MSDHDHNETLETVYDYVTEARTLLQDSVSPYRYDDDSLLAAFNVTLLSARGMRPDLFIFHHHAQVPHFSEVASDRVHIEPQFRLALLYGLVGHAILRDQEDVQDARAATYMQDFRAMLTGERPVPIHGGTPGS